MNTISPAEFMAPEPRCERSELLVSECAHCQLPEKLSSESVFLSPSFVFTARYDSECNECGLDIYEGDEITRAADNSGWIHADCRED